MLQAIVSRARTLVDTGVAYLLLSAPEEGDTYVRVTDGITTDGFKTGRLAAGTGLGGLVAATAVPYHTADYPNDARFEHTPYVDGVIGAEGLVAVQGVPLKFGDQMYGVLFAADRRVRPFSPDEVDLLISLANHAALAVENATLFEEVRKAAAVHERLTAVALDSGGPAGPASEVADVPRGSVLVLYAQDRPLASAGGHATRLGGIAGGYGGNTVAVLPADDPGGGGHTLAELLTDGIGHPVTVACDGNLSRTSAAPYVHVDTLCQRMDRISVLLGPQWRHGDHALQVHLALIMRRTAG
ncbi:GAF domain-containing protein [Streptomyces sp. NPDC127117]|uniref:GAF domain-containing protein n=1 Tax=Streptomyces sp. NPDC127117 TaxID=3345368 RepID=UPI0036443B42